MPVVFITFDDSVQPGTLTALRAALPAAVAACVACDEEPWTGPPLPGDIDLRFRPRNALDVGGFSLSIEVQSKLLPGRLVDKQARTEALHAALAPHAGPHRLSVWLQLIEGAYTES